MIVSGMNEIKIPASPQVWCRFGGALYLTIILAGIYGELVARGHLIVTGDSAATARNIVNAPLLYRSSIAVDLLMHLCDIPLIVIFYRLLRPVSKSLSLLAAFFNLVQTAILGINKISLLAALAFLGNGSYLKSFNSQQLQALSYFSLELHDYGFSIGLIFFGFRCLVVGYLIFKSEYFPKSLGVLQIVAGLCYLINSFSVILSPALAHLLFPSILLPSFIGELSMCLWLLFRGVDINIWNRNSPEIKNL
jgi:Domain of unknown function (DUF4386)